MNRYITVLLGASLLLTGCIPGFEKQEEVIQDPLQEEAERAIVPRYKISDEYYQTILPFKPGQTRGQVVPRLGSRYDVDEFETGLMRLSLAQFPSNTYLYQDGQTIPRNTVRAWLQRKEGEGSLGLNLPLVEGADDQETNENSPIILAHILEQNYLVRKNDGNVELGGVTIGLALNTVHSYEMVLESGVPVARDYPIPDGLIESEGKRMAETIAARVRDEVGSGIPIMIALYKQSPNTSIVPGTFIARATVAENSATVSRWETVNESYQLFPSTAAMNDYRDDAIRFREFKADIDDYFPNHTGVVGTGHYIEEDLQRLTIRINMDFHGKAELIGFTQYVTGLVLEHFPAHVNLQLSIMSINGPEALIIRDAGAEKPFVHIY